MAKRTVTFEVDTVKLFTELGGRSDGGASVAERLLAVLLTTSSFSEKVYLELYGISIGEENERPAV